MTNDDGIKMAEYARGRLSNAAVYVRQMDLPGGGYVTAFLNTSTGDVEVRIFPVHGGSVRFRDEYSETQRRVIVRSPEAVREEVEAAERYRAELNANTPKADESATGGA